MPATALGALKQVSRRRFRRVDGVEPELELGLELELETGAAELGVRRCDIRTTRGRLNERIG